MNQYKFYYTDTSENITNELSNKHDIIQKYNSNIGLLFSNFLISNIYRKDEKFTGRLALNTKEYFYRIFPRRQLYNILDILYKENVLYKYENSYRIPDYVNNIKGKATDYEIIANGFYENIGKLKVKSIKNKFLRKNLDCFETKRLNKLNENYKLIDSNLKNITIDEEAAYNFIQSIDIESKRNAYESCISIFNSYNRGNIDYYGRFHHKLTNLPKCLRQFVKINNSDWTNIDVKTSQPLFLAVHLNSVSSNSETKQFSKIIIEKDIYSEFDSLNQYEREARKPKFYFFLFGENHKMIYSPIYNEFKSKFPKVLNYIQEIKKKDHTVLAKTLQTLESDFIYNTATAKLRKEIPNIHLTTIHDSIGCLQGHKDFVRATMCIEFEKKYNLELKVGTENYV